MAYLDLTVKEVINETPDTITIVMDRPAGVAFKSGQFLTLILDINGSEVRRSYSLCSSPYETDRLAVSVKRVEGGLVSNYLNDNCKAGDVIKVMEPMGTFFVSPDSAAKKHYVLFAGGSGVTPMYSILKTILKEETQSLITLIFANRDEQSITFRKELDAMLAENEGRLKIIHILGEGNANWTGRTGLLSNDLIKSLLGTSPVGIDSEYYMCGPEGMMDVVLKALSAYGIPSKKVFKESFGTAPVEKKETSNSTRTKGPKMVKIMYDGDEFDIEVKEGETILEAALDADVDLPYSCQGGVCTACRGNCKSGEVSMDEMEGLSDQEVDEGYVLTCVGHPLTDNVVIEIG